MTKVHNLIECLKNWVVEVVVNLKLRVACSKYIGIGFKVSKAIYQSIRL